jgi:high affinity Mn2+ porin
MLRKEITHYKWLVVLLILIFGCSKVVGQQTDTTKDDKFSLHAQTTVINQFKPAFKANYTGPNSLIPQAESKQSITTTLFLGARLWKGASIFVNPEVAGGSGLSSSLGVGASSNGETYRIGSPAPQFELARLFLRQIFSLDEAKNYQDQDLNKLGGSIPTKYLCLTIGKICISDYFDLNQYNHDPRTQFISWGLMNNGAWDFPANTKGYTPSIVLEYISPENELRYAFSLVPTVANGMEMNWNINKAGSNTLEYTHNYTIDSQKGAMRLVTFFTTTKMGNYSQSLVLEPSDPDITSTERYGHIKYGIGINCEQNLNNNMGIFFRAGWNDGHTETWVYTEIDHSASIGFSSRGSNWNRPQDVIGLATVISGLSVPHRNYLMAGGKGFELGDGNLNYALENLTEIYYAICVSKNLYISGFYQFIVNPGFNKDRGPVNVFSFRVHTII